VNTTAVAAIATKYRNDLEGSADIHFIIILDPGNVRVYLRRGFGQKPTLRFVFSPGATAEILIWRAKRESI
jgi:hypothetical protein